MRLQSRLKPRLKPVLSPSKDDDNVIFIIALGGEEGERMYVPV
jgi:hypothetical protein